MFMYATETYTYYEHYTLPDILPWEKVYADPGQMWGPAHEIGHVNQNAINIVSCTEATNNLFANAQIFRTGKTTTRGNGLSVCREDFSNRTPFPLRGADIIAKSRMFFQLYLYFHAAGKDTTFWPRVFEALRKNPLDKGPKDRNWTSLTQAKDDQLRFAEVCCEVAQMDLSEFFEVWGMFEPMTDAGVGDYENFIVNLTKEEAEASRARMQRYEKKGGHLIFIEDRIKPSPRTDGVEGNRLDFNEEFAIGKMGSTGQWNDYIDESVKAQGYYFSRKQNIISIIADKDAKGALGFKLYNAETGELLDFNNEYKLTVPVAHSKSPLRVVVTQADGTDQELPNAAESDNEEMLIETLDGLLTTVNNFFLTKSTKTGKEIGYFHDSALTDIKIFYNEAKSAVDNKDTSKHSYKEWIALLENETERLRKDPTARVYLKELDVYTLANFDKKTNYLCYDRYGLTTNSKSVVPNTAQEKLWMFESTGVAHHYYIKNKNGLYINDITSIGTSCSGTSKDEALVFKANYLENATVYFTTADGKTYLTMNPGGDYNIIGSSSLINASTWVIRTVEFNNTAIEEVEIENEEDGTIYDLTGRKVDIPGKGIYIIDGKKVIIR
ncbi:MAG: M60 family metallopeptidase, partial [Bacteroidaceae bacterium]|nr:M60 family metallopeptidase [Bacteroidaceae bacterium]